MIYCCNGCVPPKKHGGCHATCPDYFIDSAFHAVEKAATDQERHITNTIYFNRGEKVSKAMKNRRNKKI